VLVDGERKVVDMANPRVHLQKNPRQHAKAYRRKLRVHSSIQGAQLSAASALKAGAMITFTAARKEGNGKDPIVQLKKTCLHQSLVKVRSEVEGNTPLSVHAKTKRLKKSAHSLWESEVTRKQEDGIRARRGVEVHQKGDAE
jgi:hypothetical protein